jgi:outer membrane lipoprotein-sorting protein
VRGVEKLIVLLLLVVAIAIPACAQKDAKAAKSEVEFLDGNR